MTLQTPQTIEHGIKPYGYRVQISESNDPFVSRQNPIWRDRLANLTSVDISYGVTGTYARFEMWDESIISDEAQRSELRIPDNGDRVRVFVDEGNGEFICFTGIINAINEAVVDSGKKYSIEAMSDIERLSEVNITATFNLDSDPMNPNPYFDRFGSIVENRLFSVSEIIRQIMEFGDAWQTDEFFSYDDIEWNGLENSDRCGRFVPGEVSFQDRDKGSAIQETLSRAGNYKLYFNPETTKIEIVEINLECNNCGPFWDLKWTDPTVDDLLPDEYSYDHLVTSDRTEWSTKSTTNTVRVTGSEVEFYSGHNIFADMVLRDGNTDIAANLASNENVTEEQITRNSVNLEGVNYRFFNQTTSSQDNENSLPVKQYAFGAPLYPSWNIHEDFLPSFFKIEAVNFIDGAQFNPNTYLGKYEFDTYCAGDAAYHNTLPLSQIDKLKTYEMWHSDGDCPACLGSGLVAEVYSGGLNEPVLELVPVDDAAPNGPQLLRVSNYIMNPRDFGGRDAQGNRLPFDGLSPYVDDPDTYPLPHKNMCPYCKGVGRNPLWKIRNIEPVLFRAPVNGVRNANNTVKTYTANPSQTKTGPETWDESQSRANRSEAINVQIEEDISTDTFLPARQHSDRDFVSLKNATDIPDSERVHRFPHQLIYQQNFRKFGNNIPIVPTDWVCRVPFTTIVSNSDISPYSVDLDLGNVIFNEPQAINCVKKFSDKANSKNKTYNVGPDRAISFADKNGGGMFTNDAGKPTGFWRSSKAWSTYYYKRLYWNNQLSQRPDGTVIRTQEIPFETPEGDTELYICRAMIIDGRYAVEVRKRNPTELNDFTTAGRVIQETISDESFKFQTSYNDLFVEPVPPQIHMSEGREDAIVEDIQLQGYEPNVATEMFDSMTKEEQDSYGMYLYKRDVLKLEFPQGQVFRWERPSVLEENLRTENRSDSSAEDIFRPRRITWFHKDHRCKMITRAINELESNNQLQVSGSVTAVGLAQSTPGGIGWTQYRDRARASISRISYRFGSGGLMTDIELTREEARYGELPPTEQERIIEIERTLQKIQRTDGRSFSSKDKNSSKDKLASIGNPDPVLG